MAQARSGTARIEGTRAAARAVVGEQEGLRAALGEQADELRSSHANLQVETPSLIAVQRWRARRGVRHQALNLIASGLSDRDIARTTGLSHRTVERLRADAE